MVEQWPMHAGGLMRVSCTVATVKRPRLPPSKFVGRTERVPTRRSTVTADMRFLTSLPRAAGVAALGATTETCATRSTATEREGKTENSADRGRYNIVIIL